MKRLASVRSRPSSKYIPLEDLSDPKNIEDSLERLLEIGNRAGKSQIPKAKDAEALLGAASKPGTSLLKVSSAFELYVNEIAFDEQKAKSEKQRYSWKKTKTTSVNYFIDVIGDVPMDEITREMALSYRSWWIE